MQTSLNALQEKQAHYQYRYEEERNAIQYLMGMYTNHTWAAEQVFVDLDRECFYY